MTITIGMIRKYDLNMPSLVNSYRDICHKFMISLSFKRVNRIKVFQKISEASLRPEKLEPIFKIVSRGDAEPRRKNESQEACIFPPRPPRLRVKNCFCFDRKLDSKFKISDCKVPLTVSPWLSLKQIPDIQGEKIVAPVRAMPLQD